MMNLGFFRFHKVNKTFNITNLACMVLW